MIVWIMAQSHEGDDWSLGGAFSSEERAVAACVEPTDQIWPVELDAVAPREIVAPPGAYAPLAGERP